MEKPGEQPRPTSTSRKMRAVLAKDVDKFLDRQVARMKAAYIRERRAFENERAAASKAAKRSQYMPSKDLDRGWRPGHADHPERIYIANTWASMVRSLLAARVDPVQYVQILFQVTRRKLSVLIPPTELTSQKNMKLYQEQCPQQSMDARVEFVTQQSTAHRHLVQRMEMYSLSSADATADILLDDSLALSNLFRYCLANSMPAGSKAKELAEVFRAGAYIEYVRNGEQYSTWWSKWLPPGFAEEAEAFYAEVLR